MRPALSLLLGALLLAGAWRAWAQCGPANPQCLGDAKEEREAIRHAELHIDLQMRQLTPTAWADVPAVPQASGERFRTSAQWQAAEADVLLVADEAGLSIDETLALLLLVWNESRGEANPRGNADDGCARGRTQGHYGGLGDECTPNDERDKLCLSFEPLLGEVDRPLRCWIECAVDNRINLPEPWRSLPPSAFEDPRTNLRAAALLLRRQGSRQRPVDALARYAGCEQIWTLRTIEVEGQEREVVALGDCAGEVLGRLKWWYSTGLERRFAKITRRTR